MATYILQLCNMMDVESILDLMDRMAPFKQFYLQIFGHEAEEALSVSSSRMG
jgi:uncharacterized protein YfcZ (UPF0381/DUF406 family)